MNPAVDSQDLTHIQILTLALFSLGGDARAIETEEIAVRAHSLAPGRFTWRLYPDQISLESVRRNLAHALKDSYGGMIDGSTSRGWHLTPDGLSWAAEHKADMDQIASGRGAHDKEANRRRRLTQSRLLELDAWRKYCEGTTISVREAESVFRLSEYLPADRKQLLIDRTVSLFAEDAEFADFLRAMAQLVQGDLKG